VREGKCTSPRKGGLRGMGGWGEAKSVCEGECHMVQGAMQRRGGAPSHNSA